MARARVTGTWRLYRDQCPGMPGTVHPAHGQFFAQSITDGHCAAHACCEGMSGWAKHFRWQSAYCVPQAPTHLAQVAQSAGPGAGVGGGAGVGAGDGAGGGVPASAAAVFTGGDATARQVTKATAISELRLLLIVPSSAHASPPFNEASRTPSHHLPSRLPVSSCRSVQKTFGIERRREIVFAETRPAPDQHLSHIYDAARFVIGKSPSPCASSAQVRHRCKIDRGRRSVRCFYGHER